MNFCNVWTSSSKTEHLSISGPARLFNAGTSGWLTSGLDGSDCGERFAAGKDIGGLGKAGNREPGTRNQGCMICIGLQVKPKIS